MSYRIGFLACVLLLGASVSHAVPVTFDVNDNDAVASPPGNPPPSPTFSGAIGIDQTGLTGVSTSVGTLNVSFVGVVGSGLDDRDRGQLGSGSHPKSDLLRDLIFDTATSTGLVSKGTLDVVISGLTPGQYTFTGYFHDNTVNHFLMDLSVSSDGGGLFFPRVNDAFVSTGTNPATVGSGTFQFVAGAYPVQLRLIGDGGTSGSTTAETALINGFDIEPVTLPALLGDFNNSGVVDENDFFVLRDHLGTHLDGNYVMHAGGDITFDGRVDLDDFGQFKALYPQAAAAGLGEVPEPSFAVLAMLVALGGASARRPRARN